MATPIPAFASQYIAAPSTDTVIVTSGVSIALSGARWYYFVSNRTTASNGQSLLKAVKDALDASLAGTTWTVTLGVSGGLYKVQISHNNGSSRTITFSSTIQAALGFAASSKVVAASTTVTADYPSPYWWTPDQVVSLTGPVMFDNSLTYGVPSSAGAAQRSSDMTAAYVSNGIQYEAEYTFNGVQYYYKIRPQVGHTNEDLETWWKLGPVLGRRMLFWRDRSNTTGSNAPSEGSASPWNYIEYNPQPELRSTFPAVPMNGGIKLTFWDVKLALWVTENGDTPLTD